MPGLTPTLRDALWLAPSGRMPHRSPFRGRCPRLGLDAPFRRPGSWSQRVSKFWKTLLPMNHPRSPRLNPNLNLNLNLNPNPNPTPPVHGAQRASHDSLMHSTTPTLFPLRFAPSGEGECAPRVSKVGRWRCREGLHDSRIARWGHEPVGGRFRLGLGLGLRLGLRLRLRLGLRLRRGDRGWFMGRRVFQNLDTR